MSGGAQQSDERQVILPLQIQDQLTSLIMGVEVAEPGAIHRCFVQDPETALTFVAHPLAERIAEKVWPVVQATIRGELPAPAIEVGADLRHQVRAEDRDPARHGLAIRDLREVRGDAAARSLNSGGADVKTLEQIERSFTYHPPKQDQPERYEWLRREAKDLALLIMDFCPASRERSVAITKLEEFVMWANKAIAVNE